jgi:lipopolysaccharide heptosyltransferase II
MENKRILIFNVNWLGDVLFSTATIRNIRRNFPDSYLACIVPSRCYLLLKDNPHLDEIIIFDEKDRHRGTLAKLKFAQLLKKKRFDTVFLLHRSFSRALICRLAGIPERIGYRTKKRGFLLTKNIRPLTAGAIHRIDHYLNVIEKAGLRVEDRFTEFFFSPSDEEFVADFLKKKSVSRDDFLIVINPGGNWGPKRWPAEYWERLCEGLIAEFKCKVISTGSASDVILSLKIQGATEAKVISAAGALNLKQLGALYKRADLFITADTGPLHIANAVGTRRIIALFGPTHTSITGPYPAKNVIILQKDTGCKIPCYEVSCKDNRCMKAVTPQDVLEQVRQLKK